MGGDLRVAVLVFGPLAGKISGRARWSGVDTRDPPLAPLPTGKALAIVARSLAAPDSDVFAAGAMLALAHDLAVMRSDRGYFCLPEVDLGIPFTPGMNALIRARLPIATSRLNPGE